jgi:hypothetical protein
MAGGRDKQMTDFARVVSQLGNLIEEETSALRNGNRSALAGFNYRKGHGFLEFTRAINGLGPNAAGDPGIAAMMTDLRAKLEKNQNALKVHLDAVQAVAAVLSNAIRDCDSDGTYSQSSWRMGSY